MPTFTKLTPSFSVHPNHSSASPSSTPTGGSNKRIKLSAEALKGRGLVAGQWVRVGRMESDRKESVIAQVWPSASLDAESSEISSTHSTSLSNPSQVHIYPQDVTTFKIAKSVQLERVSTSSALGAVIGTSVADNLGRARREEVWDLAVLKELMLDLAYITRSTIISLPPANHQRASSSIATSATSIVGHSRSYRVVHVVESTVVGSGGSSGTTKEKDKSRRGERGGVKNDFSGVLGLNDTLQSLTIDAASARSGDVLDGRQQDEDEDEDEGKAWAMHWKTQVAVRQVGSGATTKDKGNPPFPTSRSTEDKISARAGHLDASALPSSIAIFPPGPLHSTSESYSAYSSLGGLSPQIAQIRGLLELPLSRPEIYLRFGLKPPRGILLYGPPGTGKTHLARAIASSTPGCSCIVVNGPELSSAYHGETEERLRAVFAEARRREPCVIVLDEVDAICPKREEGGGGEVEKRVVATLLTLMDGMANGAGAAASGGGAGDENTPESSEHTPERVVVIAATNRPNAIDPALRRPGRFDREIEIGIPSAKARLDILSILIAKMPNGIEREELAAVAGRTHGYVGADLSSLVREAGTLAIRRWLGGVSGPAVDSDSDTLSRPTHAEPRLTIGDITAALPSIRASAMREVFVETPNVKWSDIGGQAHIKQKLVECVEWPLLHADTFARLGVTPPRGVLLYGPPGCSKTLTAKALATESGVNFMAVKGPELLNKFVGESERAVREIFRKARAAAPTIIFFDEIDAMATSRNAEGGHMGGVLTTLLNEMDGVEVQTNVIVVAATNRPDVLDSALLRPGRLDRILYVGPPDLQARKEILTIQLARMATEDSVDVGQLALMTEGCSGAELASVCQSAALSAMNDDVNAEKVMARHLTQAAREVRRRITPEMVKGYERWRDSASVGSV